MPIHVTGFGGVEEIGGNAFLLEDSRHKVFLDFGKQFGNDSIEATPDGMQIRRGVKPGWGDYFDSFTKPRTTSWASDLTKLGLLPPTPENYRPDLGGLEGPAGVDAVFLSHPHMDHVGLVPALKPEIPIIASAENREILRHMQQTTMGIESEFFDLRPHGVFGESDRNDGMKQKPVVEAPSRRWYDLDFDGLDWSLEAMPVDHSIPGAAGMILGLEEATVAYTGDLRIHGRERERTARFCQRAQDVDIMFVEGTRVSRDHNHGSETDDESQVQTELAAHFARAADTVSGFIGIGYPPRDLDRFVSVHLAAREAGRLLVITLKQAHLLLHLRAQGLGDLPDPRTTTSGLRVFAPAKERAVARGAQSRAVRLMGADFAVREEILDGDAWFEKLLQDYGTWERSVLASCKETYVTAWDIGQEPAAYIMTLDYWTMPQLLDIFETPEKADGIYVHSKTQPFNDDMMVQDRKLRRWLEAFHLWGPFETHVSGHLSQDDLAHFLDEAKPKTVVPIHSLHPSITADRYQNRTGQDAVLLQPGMRLQLR